MCQAYEGEHAFMVAQEQFDAERQAEQKAISDAAVGEYDNPMAWCADSTYQPWRCRWLIYHKAWLRATG